LLQLVAGLLGGTEREDAAAASSVFIDLTDLPEEGGPIRSRFAGNAKLVPIERKFAARLHAQLANTRAACDAGDLAEVERLAHWLAGAAGTVGYDAFTAPAREMEAAAKAGDVAQADGVLQRLARMEELLEVPELAVG